jgi:methyltransferase (TIGR00027 family)
MSKSFDPIALTCKLTVALRARESHRPERLYFDPYAKALADDEGYTFLDEIEALQPWSKDAPGTVNFNAIRTRFFDALLLSEVEAGASQVVLVAAGFDCRAFRLSWPGPARLYEIDRPEVLALKETRLATLSATPRCTRNVVAADLQEAGWPEALCAAGYDPSQRSVWLVEGLLYYWSAEEVNVLLSQIRALAAPGSMVGAELVNKSFLDSPATQSLLQIFARRGCPWTFGVEDPARLWASHGMLAEIVQPGEAHAQYERWATSPVELEVAGVPRVFLMCGRRQ